MRKLNSKQKNILKEWYNLNGSHATIFFTVHDLPDSIYLRLVEIGDFETIEWEINRFVSDLVSGDM